MAKNIKLLVGGVVAFAVSTALSACSSAPYYKGYSSFPDGIRGAHDYARVSQNKTNKGRFAGAIQSVDELEKKLSSSECYRIVSANYQWGLLEPEAVFIGEAVNDSSSKAYIFVPPILDENRVYPTPADEKKYKVYRLDQDLPYGTRLLSLIEDVVGNGDYCVRFAKVYLREKDQQDPVIIAAGVMHKSQYKPPVQPVAEPIKEKELPKEPPKEQIKAAPAEKPADAKAAAPAKQ
jgi:hypothetical protein